LPGSGKQAIQLLNVPDIFQATGYTCGPSSLSGVLAYFGYTHRESEIA
jgi:predicted double-glycine peptidase